MNNLLMRELPIRCTIRLWDTYLVRARDDFFTNNSATPFLLRFRPNKTDFPNFICTYVLHFLNVSRKISFVKMIFKYIHTVWFQSYRSFDFFPSGFTSSFTKSSHSRLDKQWYKHLNSGSIQIERDVCQCTETFLQSVNNRTLVKDTFVIFAKIFFFFSSSNLVHLW